MYEFDNVCKYFFNRLISIYSIEETSIFKVSNNWHCILKIEFNSFCDSFFVIVFTMDNLISLYLSLLNIFFVNRVEVSFFFYIISIE